MRIDVIGYYDDPTQDTPAHDPGPEGLCPVCCHQVGKHSTDNPLKTISLAAYDLKHRTRSYFLRAHKNCWEHVSEDERNKIESSVIDEHIDSANDASDRTA